MILPVLFIGEGSSDSGITSHIRRVVADHGHTAAITDPYEGWFPPPPRKTVAAKLQVFKELGGEYKLVVLHRDGDSVGREPRLDEICGDSTGRSIGALLLSAIDSLA